jgi:hypothetical protein
MTMKRFTVWLDDEIDTQAIMDIKQRYGCESDATAMRLAIRVLAASPMLAIQPPEPPPHARRSPKLENEMKQDVQDTQDGETWP